MYEAGDNELKIKYIDNNDDKLSDKELEKLENIDEEELETNDLVNGNDKTNVSVKDIVFKNSQNDTSETTNAPKVEKNKKSCKKRLSKIRKEKLLTWFKHNI